MNRHHETPESAIVRHCTRSLQLAIRVNIVHLLFPSCKPTTAGNIITEGVLMAEELNMHFSSVFTREDTSSLPVPETKFNGTEGERLGQLVITPEVIANKINNMQDNK